MLAYKINIKKQLYFHTPEAISFKNVILQYTIYFSNIKYKALSNKFIKDVSLCR